jgi:hypothetical protein
MTLTRRLEKAALAKFDGDKRKAAKYLRDQATYFAYKSDRYARNPLLQKYQPEWSKVYRAYSSAAYNTEYWISVEEEYVQDILEEQEIQFALALEPLEREAGLL